MEDAQDTADSIMDDAQSAAEDAMDTADSMVDDAQDAVDDATAGATCDAPDEVSLQLQWVTQAQFAGYYAAQDQGFYDDMCLDVTIVEGGVDIVPQTQLANGDVDFAIWPGSPRRWPAGRPGRTSSTSPRSISGRAPSRCRSPTRESRRPTTSPARRSATGVSATSTRCSPRSVRQDSTRPPTSSSSARTSTWPRCSTVRSTPPRR